MIGRRQPMNSWSPPSSRDQLVAGLDEEVERVAEHHVVAELGDLARVQRLHRRRRRERHEGRRAHGSVRRRITPARAAPSRALISKAATPDSGLRAAFRSSRSASSSPSRARTVGATSESVPPSRSSPTSPVTISGTGFIEWAVFGLPSGSSIWSALPWSAVMMQTPPYSCTASTTSPRHSSTVSTAFTAASITPVCPTMSGLAKLMIPKP